MKRKTPGENEVSDANTPRRAERASNKVDQMETETGEEVLTVRCITESGEDDEGASRDENRTFCE